MDLKRRHLLKGSALLPAAMLATGCSSKSAFEPVIQPYEPASLSQKEISALGQQGFEALRGLIRFDAPAAPLNSANLSPAYEHSLASLHQFQEQLSANPDFITRKKIRRNGD